MNFAECRHGAPAWLGTIPVVVVDADAHANRVFILIASVIPFSTVHKVPPFKLRMRSQHQAIDLHFAELDRPYVWAAASELRS